MSLHFTRGELIRSQKAQEKGIDNTCPEGLLANLDFTRAGAERVRAFLGHRMIVLSGYRCYELNREVGGSENSQHKVALAMDFVCPDFGDPQTVAKALAPMRYVLGIDQLILESSWVHVSFTLDPRYQVLRCVSPGHFIEGL